MMARPNINNALGAILLTLSWVFFTTEMVCVRIISSDLSIAQIGVFRVSAQVVVLLPFVLFSRGDVLRTTRLPMHFLRAGCSSSGMVLFYLAFAMLPFALATTLTFTQAMFLILFAAIFLGETIGSRRIGAVLVGFFGVLVVMRPGLGGFDPAMIVALVGALVAAALMIVTRSLSTSESRITIMLYSSWLGLLFISIPAALLWKPVLPEHWLLLGVVGGAGTIGQFLMVGAFQVAEASALAPIDYVRLVFAVVAGYLAFGEIPDLWTWSGSAIVVGSVAYATYRERLNARLRVTPAEEIQGKQL
jgi:drug/metabolite transporter (DMT)-like permease